jgi:hypothetical protein
MPEFRREGNTEGEGGENTNRPEFMQSDLNQFSTFQKKNQFFKQYLYNSQV